MSDSLLHFWNPDRPGCKPKTVAQAAEMCLRLADEPAPPEPKFRAFLTALLKDWPSEQTLTGPDDPRVPVWDGCPLRALDHLDVARLSLRLPADGGLHLFVAMVEAAQQAGLVAFEDSEGWLWLPPSLLRPQGTVLPQAKAAEWASFVQQVRHEPRPVTLAEMMKDLMAQVRGVLEPDGWTVEDLSRAISCQRVISEQGVRQQIFLSSREVWGDHMYGIEAVGAIAVMVLHDAFDEAVRDLKAHYPEACKILSIANIHGNRPWGGGVKSLGASWSDIEGRRLDDLPIDTLANRQHIVDRLRRQVVPLTNDYLTPKALNALMDSGEIKRYLPDWSGDPESSHFDHSSVGTLFFAWMNRSPRVPRLAARYRAETQRMGKLRALNESDAKQEQFIAFVLSHEPPDVGQFAD